MRRGTWAAIGAVLIAALVAALRAESPATGPVVRTGPFQVQFTRHSPEADPAKLVKRVGWSVRRMQQQGLETTFNIEKESVEVYVPANYDGTKPFGLLVWVSASPSGRAHEPWLRVLDKHHVIWIGANNSGNDRSVLIRLCLAIEATYNAKVEFKIDEDRVYVAGGSGGGRCSSILGVACADLFRGGFYMIGSDYFRPLAAEQPNQVYPITYLPPGPKVLKLAKEHSRHVLLTGDKDGNRSQTKANYELGFLADEFQHVTYMQVPGMGHQLPPADWFEKGIEYLDDRSEESVRVTARVIMPTTQSSPAASQPAPSAGQDPAERLLRIAKLYVANHRPEDAKLKLRDLIQRYPQSRVCDEGRKLLARLESQ